MLDVSVSADEAKVDVLSACTVSEVSVAMEVEVEVVSADEAMSDATTPCTLSEVVVAVVVEVEVVSDGDAMGDTAVLCAMSEVVVMVEVEVEVVSAEEATLEATTACEATVVVIAVVVKLEVVVVGDAGAGTALEDVIFVEVALEAGIVCFVAVSLPAKRSVCAPSMKPYAPLSDTSSAPATSVQSIVPPAYLLASAPGVEETLTYSACSQ